MRLLYRIYHRFSSIVTVNSAQFTSLLSADSTFKPDVPSFVNVAKEGSASATSVGWGGVPSRVKDGNTNGYWGGLVSQTSLD